MLLNGEEDCGASGNIVIRLSRSIPRNVGHKLFFDNYFTSPQLQVYMAVSGIYSVGTVRANRIPNCTLKNENEMKKLGRGGVDEKVNIVDGVEITAIRWLDNKPVTLLSTFAGCEPASEVTRWNAQKVAHEKVTCPTIVAVYNKHMGGVDLFESLIGLYRIRLRSKKWYHQIFFHLLDMTVINARLFYRTQRGISHQNSSKVMALHEFKANIAEALCSCATVAVAKRRCAVNIHSFQFHFCTMLFFCCFGLEVVW